MPAITLPGPADASGRETAGVLLEARRASRRFGSRLALAPTSLEVRREDALALIGPNGAGKSTLLSLLAGALRPTAGEIRTAEPPPHVGWVPQRPAQYGRLSPRENLTLFARLEGIAEPTAAAGRLLELVELAGADRPSAELSVGNQQRLNLAIALLGEPDVLLLDEPSAALDPRQRRRLWELAVAVREQGGAVVFATQNLEELERFATRVAVLLDGELIFAGTTAEFARSPESDVFA